MKKFLSGLFLAFLFISCSDNNAISGPYKICNNTDEKLTFYIEAETYTPFTVEIPANSEKDIDIFYYVPNIQIVKNSNEITNTSNKYCLKRSGFIFSTENNLCKSYILNPSDEILKNKISICEKNNKNSEWKNDQVLSDVEKNKVIKIFGGNFSLTFYENNSESTEIEYKTEDNQIVIDYNAKYYED